MMWAALGDYRGPLSVRAFMRYADSRLASYEHEEIYRVYMSRYLCLLVGAERDYFSTVYEDDVKDFDPEEVVDSTISKLVG